MIVASSVYEGSVNQVGEAVSGIGPRFVEWSPLQVGDIPAYLGVVAAVLAVLFAALSLRKQSETARQQHEATAAQLDHLRAEASRIRALDERNHASLISAWFTDDDVSVLNASNEPVYEVVITSVMVQGAGPRTGEEVTDCKYRKVYQVLPPGEWVTQLGRYEGAQSTRSGIEVGFTDRNSKHWIRRSSGELCEVDNNLIDYYEYVGRPLGFEQLLSR